MSVINKMLKDLDQRQQSADNNIYTPGNPSSSSRLLVITLSSAVVLLIGAVAGVWWYYSDKTENAQSVQMANNDGFSQSSVTPDNSALTNKEESDNRILTAVMKDKDIAALEDEIYGPENVMPPSSEIPAPQTVKAPSAPREEDTPKVMKVQTVTLTLDQEIELDRKAAGLALSQGNIPQAKDSFQSILAKDPRNTSAREKLASLAYGEGNWIQAQTILQQGIALQPAYANYRLLLARILMEHNRNREALTVLTGFSPRATADNLDYLATEASLATDLNEPLIAVEAYSKLTRIMPKEGKWWLGLAISFDRQGTVSAARANYKQALTVGVPSASRKFAQERLAELEGK